MKNFKLDKTISKIRSHAEGEKEKVFTADVTLSERLHQSWYLTCMAFGIDPENPPRMVKKLTYKGKLR